MNKQLKLVLSRLRTGLKSWEVASKLRISASKYSMIENGRICPTADEKLLLAKIINSDPKDLFDQGYKEQVL